jgi:hypothetical protein
LEPNFAQSYRAVRHGVPIPDQLSTGYATYKSDFLTARGNPWGKQRSSEASRRAAIRDKAKRKRLDVRAAQIDKAKRKLRLAIVNADEKAQLDRLRERIGVERRDLRARLEKAPRPLTMRGWVMAQAKSGDQVAVDYLSAVREKQHVRVRPPESVEPPKMPRTPRMKTGPRKPKLDPTPAPPRPPEFTL